MFRSIRGLARPSGVRVNRANVNSFSRVGEPRGRCLLGLAVSLLYIYSFREEESFGGSLIQEIVRMISGISGEE